jgi:glycerophosphoryl diester phosphodiesterase
MNKENGEIIYGLQAFERAFRLQSLSGIECDLRRVQSGEIVIYHDAKQKNTKQYLKDLTLSEVKNIIPDICTLHDLLKLATTHSYTGLLNLVVSCSDRCC